MSKIDTITSLVRELYEQKNTNRDSLADYLYAGHIFLVANEWVKLVERYGWDKACVIAWSLLHDVADAVMSRFAPSHDDASVHIATEFLETAGFTQDEKILIIQDILPHHGCRNGILPNSLEWKIVAAADAIIHLESDFYHRLFLERTQRWEDKKTIQDWAYSKIDRDFFVKISFDDIRENYREAYESSKKIFL